MSSSSEEEKESPTERTFPEKTRTSDYLKSKGIESLGDVDSIVFKGELISEAEEKALIEERKEDGKARRRMELLNFILKDALVHAVGILLIAALAMGSGFILSQEDSSTQDREWARAILSAISGAVAGYVFGKSSSGEQ